MSNRDRSTKHVALQHPVSIKEGRVSLLEALCSIHRVGVDIDAEFPAYPIFTLTTESQDLPLFARCVSSWFTGPRKQVAAFVRDLSTTEDPYPKHVLVVEDDPGVQAAYKRMLRRICHITLIDNADDAVCLLRTIEFDLIFCDFELIGGPTGRHVYNFVRDKHPEALRKFYFVSGNSAVHEIHYQCIDKGSNEFTRIDELVLQ